MVGLLHAMAIMVLLLIGWVIWNNKPLPNQLPLPIDNRRALTERLFHCAAAERLGNFPWPYPQPQCSVHRPSLLAPRHQTGHQYPAVEWTRANVSVRNVVAPRSQPDHASRVRSASRDVNFCEMTQGVGVSSASRPTWLRGIRSKGVGFVVVDDFYLTHSFPVVEVEDGLHCFCSGNV